MNVLYYHGAFPKISESFVLNEIYELEQRGHNVSVCALNRPSTNINHDEFDELDIAVNYVPRPQYHHVTELISPRILRSCVLSKTWYRSPVRVHAANLFRAKRCIEFVDSIDFDVDHVHTHFASASRFGARFVASYFQVPFTITTHAKDLYRKPVGEYTSTLLQSAQRVITISEYNERHIREEFIDDTPIDVVRAGIRPEKFVPTDETVPNRVFTVCRFVEKKGVEYALKAVKRALEAVPDLEYHLVGSGEREDELRALTHELEIEDAVTFLSNVSDSRLLDELDRAQCFLLPCVIAESGDRDGIPVALMEAMVMKTPPVSTAVSGIPELIDHERNGLLVEPKQPQQTADALVSILTDDETRETYGERARKTVVGRFNITKEVDKLESSFEKAANN